jgi:site-specific DNA recombinase
VSKHEGGGQARYEVVWDEARIVRRLFASVGRDRMTIGAVARRLTQQGVPTRTGKRLWDRSTVWGILQNPAYKGTAAYGKARHGQRRWRLRPARGQPEQPRRPFSRYDVMDSAIPIEVPALVGEDLFAVVAEQLQENRQRHRQRAAGARHLLQGLLVCARCGYACHGKPVSRTRSGARRSYCYYRCGGAVRPTNHTSRCLGRRRGDRLSAPRVSGRRVAAPQKASGGRTTQLSCRGRLQGR